MNNKFKHIHLLGLSLLLIPWAQAHHGREFLLTEDPMVPEPGHGHLMLGAEFDDADSGEEWGLEPGVMLGVSRWIGLDLSARFGEDSESDWDYQAVSAGLLISPSEPSWPVRIGLGLGYNFAQESATHDHHHDMDHETMADEEDTMTHEHHGIHAHGISGFHARLIAETDLTDDLRFVANLVGMFPEDGTPAWGYAYGLRYSVNSDLSFGLEGTGDFDSEGEQLLLGAVYWRPTSCLTLKLGAGPGLTDQSPDLAVRAGVAWCF